MPTVRLSFTAAPAHVRTARLVGVAVARRAGVSPDLFDEIRLAIGEACSRAVALHRQHGLSDLVDVALTDGETFTVRVTDRAPIEAALGPAVPDLADPVAPRPGEDRPGSDLWDGTSRPVDDRTPTDPQVEEAEEAVAVGMRLALLAGLVDQITVRPAESGPGTEVVMSWPAAGRVNGVPG